MTINETKLIALLTLLVEGGPDCGGNFSEPGCEPCNSFFNCKRNTEMQRLLKEIKLLRNTGKASSDAR